MDAIKYDDFKKLDIRIGTVVEAEVPEWSHWVLKMVVDFASEAESDTADAKSSKDRSSERAQIEPESQEVKSGGGESIGKRTIFAGLMKFYTPKDLIGNQYPFIVNIEPKKIGPEGDKSEGMMIMAVENPENEEVAPTLFSLAKKVPNGTQVM